jgi:hypothetical protein
MDRIKRHGKGQIKEVYITLPCTSVCLQSCFRSHKSYGFKKTWDGGTEACIIIKQFWSQVCSGGSLSQTLFLDGSGEAVTLFLVRF